MRVYVAEPAAGTPVYERCSFNPRVPIGVQVERAGVRAIVSVTWHFGRGYVEAQYDLPPGTTIVLQDNAVMLDRRDGRPAEALRFPGVSPAGPASNSDRPESTALRKLMLPVETPLVGGRSGPSWNKHYWIAARLGADPTGDVWITLPPFTIDGTPERLPEIHFSRRWMIAVVGPNC